jgi:hypothetical protein
MRLEARCLFFPRFLRKVCSYPYIFTSTQHTRIMELLIFLICHNEDNVETWQAAFPLFILLDVRSVISI